MEKMSPQYSLALVQAVVADFASRPFTMTALRGGLELGLTESEMRQVIMKLSRRNFYKSMTTHANHKGMAGCLPRYHRRGDTGIHQDYSIR